MSSNDILDDLSDFSLDRKELKTQWWAVVVSTACFTLFTFMKWKYLFMLIPEQWKISVGYSFVGLILFELVLF
ncbi:MAG: hypothetical protein ACI94Y_004100 [Maribacter sp.]|jgi:hypothetical protein